MLAIVSYSNFYFNRWFRDVLSSCSSSFFLFLDISAQSKPSSRVPVMLLLALFQGRQGDDSEDDSEDTHNY